jgi:hypothetical protein
MSALHLMWRNTKGVLQETDAQYICAVKLGAANATYAVQ